MGLAFNPQSVANISVAPGPGAIAAGKSIACNQAARTYTCLATGLNANSIRSGLTAQMTVSFSRSYVGVVSFGVINTRGVTAAGTAVPISGMGATVIVYGLTSLVCSPTTVPSGSATNCTVTMSPAAPSGGAKIFLASNSPLLVVPAAVNMAARGTSATFSAHTGNIFEKRTATITASYSGSSRRATLSLGSARSHPRILSCDQTVVPAGTGTTCTLALSSEEEAGQLTVSWGPSLRVPPVIDPPGQQSLRFQRFCRRTVYAADGEHHGSRRTRFPTSSYRHPPIDGSRSDTSTAPLRSIRTNSGVYSRCGRSTRIAQYSRARRHSQRSQFRRIVGPIFLDARPIAGWAVRFCFHGNQFRGGILHGARSY